jgi:hypothetical protein
MSAATVRATPRPGRSGNQVLTATLSQDHSTVNRAVKAEEFCQCEADSLLAVISELRALRSNRRQRL